MASSRTEDIHRYWGKYATNDGLVWHLLPYHCLDVAAVGNELLRRDDQVFQKTVGAVPLRDEYVCSLILFFLAVHDVGKFSERFQGLNTALQSGLQGSACHMPYSHHHSTMGMLVFMREIWPQMLDEHRLRADRDEDPFDLEDLFLPWIRAVTGHHGKPVTDSGTLSDLFSPADREAACGFARACSDLFLSETPEEPIRYSTELHEAFTRISWLIAGLAVLSDWIGSDSNIFEYRRDPMPLDEYWQHYAVPRAKEAVARAGVLPSLVAPFLGIASFLPEGAVPTPLQEAAADCELAEGPCLFIIEDVTGSGKTEAALALTHRLMERGSAEGVFMALPTMATANGMYRRFTEKYRQFFVDGEHPSLLLSHSARNLSNLWRQSIGPQTDKVASPPGEEAGSVECAAWLSDNRKKSLLADIGVGTIDQALMAVMPLHHQSLRLLGLARHVLVVDEVHAYDEYMNTLLERLLQFHAAFGGSAILLSATLPIRLRERFVAAYRSGLQMPATPTQEAAFPLMTMTSSQGVDERQVQANTLSQKTVVVELTDSETDVEAYLERALRDGHCACWIRNTVIDAVETYERLAARWGDEHVKLFHARFTTGDRQRIEDDVLAWFGKQSTDASRRGKILVATQVVEQSLDIDFDAMATDLAPIDLIIQRAGRLHRHRERRSGTPETPALLVLSPPPVENPERDWFTSVFPRAGRVYEKHGQLWLTARLLAARKLIVMPDDARSLIEGVFGDAVQASVPEALKVWEVQADGKDRGHAALAQINALRPQTGYADLHGQWEDDSRTPTRLGEASVTVVLACGDRAGLRPWNGAEGATWEGSLVSVRESLIAGPIHYSVDEEREIARVKPLLPGRGEGSILIPLTHVAGGTWEGRARNRKDKEVIVTYDSKIGLQIRDGR
ncbi:CRISPR-associated helicase Cas3' [Methanoculleus sp. Wushi-C6]|uniref:CRISPR-associated helicase Cas3 n=1 Tax=Methanoculleus caldifontis TaxID=2651577 RepID=A0ABU3X3Q7_9EURY|nr:CRISPR-associated helicase Cas3' [Methanoculleus sp. Wushi-C6]MDV2482237.1 CRISPR-associated helicase Cas3' [Methanoculleus sp. Wushi-C6]